MIKLKYGNRSITWGNEALITADYDRTGETFKNIELITGMVKAKAMEDKGSVTNYPADDMADHGSKRGASILEGELTLIQADPTFKVSMLGHIESENGFGTVPTGNYPKKSGAMGSPDATEKQNYWSTRTRLSNFSLSKCSSNRRDHF
ncbi:hypothetical protein [Lactococcus fujiensis]|uniref:hypothetical protein n=1 Tax=Lactococcus fujiensis TaxID=610251 RepID=UPI0006D0E68E|nr:hypothetical protein [Lactococcus fujiensis]